MAAMTDSSILECEMSIKTVRLEKEYEKALSDSAHLLDVEKDRVKRMENLLLQFESDNLRSQLDQANQQLRGSTHAESDTLLQLNEASREIRRLDNQLKSSSNEIQRLKDELSSTNSTSASHKSLISEKIQLTKELSNVKSELDRIKTQSSSQQASIAARQEMERQYNSLEVQLENEKQAHERTRTQLMQHSAESDKLNAQIVQLQNDLVKHTRASQQSVQEMRQQRTEFEGQRTVFETKIETLRKQLRSAKDKLQEAQHDLQQKRNTAKNNDGASIESQSRTIPLQRPGPSSDHHNGLTIATPGAVRVQEKIKRQSALPGDKSSFSITPFLNRTGGPLDSPDSPELSDLDEREVKQAMADGGSPFQPQIPPRFAALNSSPMDQSHVARGPTKGTKAKAKSREGKSASLETADEPKKVIKRTTGKVPLKDADELQIQAPEQEQAKPKKRKLGAQRDRGLFEDDEEDLLETRKPARKVGLGAGRSSGLPTAPILGTSVGDRNPKTLGFGGFSPLKRDRKR
ncbi:hypothetical protein N7528_005022 [Penicillium herquei]|nr:hypothetical protein N7528_005022 [Penicillium herquei]